MLVEKWANRSLPVAGGLMFGSMICLGVASDFDPGLMAQPASSRLPDQAAAIWLRTGLLLDLFGYYLLLLPYLFTSRVVGGSSRYCEIRRTCGILYVTTGALGAVFLAAVLPTLVIAAQSDPAATTLYRTLMAGVHSGIWGLLTLSFAAGWWFLEAVLGKPGALIGRISLAVSISSSVAIVGNIVGSTGLATVGLLGYLFGAPVWAIATYCSDK